MTSAKWTKAMSVGVPELDDDHKGLFELINRVDAQVEDESPFDLVRQSLMALRRYAEFHFAREEAVMLRCDFAGLTHHREEHRHFVVQVQEIDGQLDGDPDASAIFVRDKLSGFLHDWWRHHILIQDKAYKRYAAKKPVEAREGNPVGARIARPVEPIRPRVPVRRVPTWPRRENLRGRPRNARRECE
jgi:hemerythrin